MFIVIWMTKLRLRMVKGLPQGLATSECEKQRSRASKPASVNSKEASSAVSTSTALLMEAKSQILQPYVDTIFLPIW